MKVIPLKELCQIRHGGTPSKANPHFWRGSIPWVSPKDMKAAALEDATDHISEDAVANSATSVVPEGSILIVARSGILAHSIPVAQAKRSLAFNQDIKAIIPNLERIDPDYLFWFIRAQEPELLVRGVKKGATVHSLQSGVIENLRVPVPRIERQRRIVDLLSHADGIVRLRREAQAKAAEIIPALFLDMFGDPERNPMVWPVKTIGDLCGYTRYGPRFPDRKYATAGAHILRTTDMDYTGDLNWRASPILPVTDDELARYRLKAGTLLVTRTGATIGKTALFRGAEEPCIAGAYLIEFGLNGQALPEYVLHFLLGEGGQARLRRGTRAVAQPNINAPAVCAIPIPLPPLGLQSRFAAMTEQIRAAARLQVISAARAESTFAGLLARVFTESTVTPSEVEHMEALA